MRGSVARPRVDQVAELTRGIRLPLPAISEVHLEVLAECLGKAFDDLLLQRPDTMLLGNEPELTALIEAYLNSLIDKNVFWRQLVVCVARGKESINFDGSHLEKRPDLSIYLSDRTRRFPFVVETKILDAPNGRKVASYCKDGLLRFVKGEYAWGSQEAMMIGYIRDGSSIKSELKKFLMKDMNLKSPKFRVKKLPIHTRPGGWDFAYTQHDRAFVYNNQTPPNSPGLISVWHLWLSSPEG